MKCLNLAVLVFLLSQPAGLTWAAEAQENTQGTPVLDSFEPDDTFLEGTFLTGFDFLTDGPLVVDQQHWFHDNTDQDWVMFTQTFNYPTSWVEDDPNTRLSIRACDGECDAGPDLLTLNVTVFDENFAENPAAQPIVDINACPGIPGDLAERFIPCDLADKVYFVRVRECNGLSGEDLPYNLTLTRDSVGIDIHLITGRVLYMDSASQLVASPPLASLFSNYNDFTFANPTNGEFQVAVLARDFDSGVEVEDLVLTASVPGLGEHSQLVSGLVASEETVLDFQLNLFRSGFE